MILFHMILLYLRNKERIWHCICKRTVRLLVYIVDFFNNQLMSGGMSVYMNTGMLNKLPIVTIYIRQKSRFEFNKCSCMYILTGSTIFYRLSDDIFT